MGFGACFVFIAVLVQLDRAAAFDLAIIHAVQSAESAPLTSLAKSLSLVGSTQLAIVISLVVMGLLFLLLKHRVEIVLFLWVGLGSQVLNTLMKLWFRRERPDLHRMIEQAGFSFPSGHSMAAFSLYGVTAFLLWRHLRSRRERVVLILLVVFMTGGIGWSRIYLGVHYPSDVIGGYAVSGAWLMLSITLFQKYRESREKKNRNGKRI
ncbi:phosphatase PAP2 family protein [Paenibacillus donghaensis]|uniref:phosphatase PAP2 family protein n=1 Tax=Paenibacillus donghaensis TaxID=414771 RepID=UPI001FEB34DC|nr:phosphatase PAP2 family protein [Paenibacillus donghaensis]